MAASNHCQASLFCTVGPPHAPFAPLVGEAQLLITAESSNQEKVSFPTSPCRRRPGPLQLPTASPTSTATCVPPPSGPTTGIATLTAYSSSSTFILSAFPMSHPSEPGHLRPISDSQPTHGRNNFRFSPSRRQLQLPRIHTVLLASRAKSGPAFSTFSSKVQGGRNDARYAAT